jgi:hypothetical protein
MSDIREYEYDDLCAAPLKFRGMVFVSKADHVAAVAEARVEGRESVAKLWDADKDTFPGRIAEAEQRVGEAWATLIPPLVKQGQKDAIAKAVAAVEALPFDFPLDDIHRGRIHKAAAIAAIKGLGK